ncbi:RNA polymerase sigma factor [Aquimarina sp. Aq107]|uniref:RNA polymerase sigma factor n=1 Tax=Aquimarina sp. Aq107 TaxID=1191912 RepID=UPI000D561549|nr:sigma-70 family RNA polymerase sigma factor [Aquimarina sp. Aq107]
MSYIINEDIFQSPLYNNNSLSVKNFYEDNFSMIKNYVIQNSGNEEDAKDLFQDALIIVYEKLNSDSLRIQSSLNSYFFGVCKNLWKNILRRKKKLLLISNSFNENSFVEDQFDQKELNHIYVRNFEKLSNSNKKILCLFFKGITMREIAKINGYTEGYAGKRNF